MSLIISIKNNHILAQIIKICNKSINESSPLVLTPIYLYNIMHTNDFQVTGRYKSVGYY